MSVFHGLLQTLGISPENDHDHDHDSHSSKKRAADHDTDHGINHDTDHDTDHDINKVNSRLEIFSSKTVLRCPPLF